MSAQQVTSVEQHTYSLTSAERNHLLDELWSVHSQYFAECKSRMANDGGTPPVVAVAIDGLNPISNLGRQLEQQIFDAEAGDHSVESMIREMSPYENRSIFLMVVDLEARDIVGISRFVTSSAGFGPATKSIADALTHPGFSLVPEEFSALDDRATIDLRSGHDRLVGRVGKAAKQSYFPFDRTALEAFHDMVPGDGILDIASLVTTKQYRLNTQFFASTMLYAGAFRVCDILRLSHCLMIVRTDLFTQLEKVFGLPMEVLGRLPAAEYVEGDPFLSSAGYIDVHEVRRMLERTVALQAPGLLLGDAGLTARFSLLSVDSKQDWRFHF